MCFFVCLFVFGLFRAASTAYESSQTRGGIRATAAGLHHSHRNTRSQPHLQPTPQLRATPDSQPTHRGQGSNPASSGMLVRFLTRCATTGTPCICMCISMLPGLGQAGRSRKSVENHENELGKGLRSQAPGSAGICKDAPSLISLLMLQMTKFPAGVASK